MAYEASAGASRSTRRWRRGWRSGSGGGAGIGGLSPSRRLARPGDCPGGTAIGRPGHRATEDRHDHQPPLGELVVADHGVAVGAAAAHIAVAGEQRVRADGPEERAAGRVELRALLGEDGELRVDDLEDVVWARRRGCCPRGCAAACAPAANPAPSPSKLSSTGNAGRVPCDVCSTTALEASAGGGATCLAEATKVEAVTRPSTQRADRISASPRLSSWCGDSRRERACSNAGRRSLCPRRSPTWGRRGSAPSFVQEEAR